MSDTPSETDMAKAGVTRDAEPFNPKPARLPPGLSVGPLAWMKQNLFATWLDTIITIICAVIIFMLVRHLVTWGILDSVWDAANRRECMNKSPEGACWAGPRLWFHQFIYGLYNVDERWRVNLGFFVLVAWMVPLFLSRVTVKLPTAAGLVLTYPLFTSYLFYGGEKGIFWTIVSALGIACFIWAMINLLLELFAGKPLGKLLEQKFGMISLKSRMLLLLALWAAVSIVWSGVELEVVRTVRWGGLFVTMVVAGIGITFALPAGIVLALGRRSKLPLIRIVCVVFIEVFRSVPLITVLFMATTMVPLFLPEGVTFDKLLRAIIAVCLFAAAYMAEVVRGGLQSIPRGQYEAAAAMGLGYWRTTGLIIMPQALKLMIPNILSNFIGLFKDTTLVAIIGLFDLLGMVQAMSEATDWIGLVDEPYLFAALVYFIGCFAMSRYARHLENKLSTEHR